MAGKKKEDSLFTAEEIGKRLNKLKKDNGLTVGEVSAKMDEIVKKLGKDISTKPETLNSHFQGRNIPGTDYLYLYSLVFDVSIDFLLTGKDKTELSEPNKWSIELSLKLLRDFVVHFKHDISIGIKTNGNELEESSIVFKNNEFGRFVRDCGHLLAVSNIFPNKMLSSFIDDLIDGICEKNPSYRDFFYIIDDDDELPF